MSGHLKLIISDVWQHIILYLAVSQMLSDKISFLPWLHFNMTNVCVHWTKLILKYFTSLPADIGMPSLFTGPWLMNETRLSV